MKGDGGKRRFEMGRLRTRVTRESEADGFVGWLRPRMKGDVGKLWGRVWSGCGVQGCCSGRHSEATMQAVTVAVTVLVTVKKASDVGRTIFN